MKDFEQLLEQTLQEVCGAESRSGIETRIMTRVAAEAQSGLRWRLLSGVIAAGLFVALLFHAGTRRQTKPPIAVTRVVASGANCMTRHETCLSAPRTKQTGLKARDIGGTHRLPTRSIVEHRDRPPRSKLPRDASLRISPIIIAPLRMEEMEVASLTLKNKNQRGVTP